MANDTSSAPASAGKPSPVRRVGREMAALSGWKKALLGFFLVLAVAGAGLWVHGRLNAETVQPSVSTADAESPRLSTEGSPSDGEDFTAQGFVSPNTARTMRTTPTPGDGVASEDEPTVEPTEVAEPTLQLPWTGRLGGWMVKLGLSFAVGLVLGVFFRTFLKTMAVVTAVAVAGIVGLSYFEILPIDFTTMRANYDTAAGWIGGQAERIRDVAMAFLPSATAGGFGFFVGFLRR